MTLRGTLLLLFLALGLILGIIFLEPYYRQSYDKTIFHGVPEKVTKVTIIDGNDTHSLDRHHEGWALSTTPADRVDSEEINHLLGVAYAIQPLDILSRRDLHHQLGLSTLGLLNPKRLLILHGEKNNDQTLYFGNEAVGDKCLFACSGKKGDVMIIPSTLSDIAFRPIDEFRDHRLTSLNAKQLERLSLHQGKGDMTLVSEESSWKMTQPILSSVDTKAISTWIDPLLSSHILTRVGSDDGDLSLYGLDHPRAEITLLESGKKEPIILSLGKTSDDKESSEEISPAIYLRSSERHAIFKIPRAMENVFMISPDSLRDRQFFRLNLDTVDRIAITKGGKELTLHRQGGGSSDWITEEKNPRKIPGSQLEELVKIFERTQISAFQLATPAHLQEAGLELPTGPANRIRFIAHLSENTPDDNAGDHTVAEITFGTPTASTLFARLGNASDLVQIPSKTLEALDEIYRDGR